MPTPIIVETNGRIGARIRAARLAAGLTQTALGQALGVSHQQVHKYELGQDRVAAGTLYEIARATGQPIAVFFEDCAAVEHALETPPMRTADALQTVRSTRVSGCLAGLAEAIAPARPSS